MKLDDKMGVLEEVTFLPSPNCDDRPKNTTIDLLVIHNISLPPGQFGGAAIIDFFCNRLNPSDHPFFQSIVDLHVSSHVLIRRDGQVIQFVPFHKRAWHAGFSQFAGRDKCNDFSIGIELEGADDIPYEKIQYQQLALVTDELLHHYPQITLDRIVGHSAIAPERKTDPGPSFDWVYFQNILKGFCSGLC